MITREDQTEISGASGTSVVEWIIEIGLSAVSMAPNQCNAATGISEPSRHGQIGIGCDLVVSPGIRAFQNRGTDVFREIQCRKFATPRSSHRRRVPRPKVSEAFRIRVHLQPGRKEISNKSVQLTSSRAGLCSVVRRDLAFSHDGCFRSLRAFALTRCAATRRCQRAVGELGVRQK